MLTDGFGVGYTYTRLDFDRLYGKIGKAAGNTASTSTQPSLVDPADGDGMGLEVVAQLASSQHYCIE